MLLFIFLDKNGFKKIAESEELANAVVIFYKNESKGVLKYTANYFKK